MELNELKKMLSDALPQGEKKEDLLNATDKELSKLASASEAEAMKIYRDYKNLKSEILKLSSLKSLKQRYKVTIYNDSFEKKVINILNRAFLLASEELTDYKDKVDELAKKYGIGGKEFSGFFGHGVFQSAFSNYNRGVLNRVKEFFGNKKDVTLADIRKEDVVGRIKTLLDYDINFIRSDTTDYINSIFKTVSKPEVINSMPGVKVFFRILLGIAGVEKADKGMKDDGTGIETNRKYTFNGWDLGKGLFALIAYSTLTFAEDYHNSENPLEFK